jgi:hypothetical protein
METAAVFTVVKSRFAYGILAFTSMLEKRISNSLMIPQQLRLILGQTQLSLFQGQGNSNEDLFQNYISMLKTSYNLLSSSCSVQPGSKKHSTGHFHCSSIILQAD